MARRLCATGSFSRIPGSPIDHAPILAMTSLPQGRMLFATPGGGLYSFDGWKIHHHRRWGQTPSKAISIRFFTDPDGLLWMGTIGGGLRMLDGERLFSYSSQDGLFDDDIFGIQPDDRDRLWIACSKGIFSVNRLDLRKFAAGRDQAVRQYSLQPDGRPAHDRMQAGSSAWRLATCAMTASGSPPFTASSSSIRGSFSENFRRLRW